MPVFLAPDTPGLPPPERADRYGVVAVGGDLSVDRLVLAYRTGIFPWYSEGLPVHWHSPDPRFLLLADELRVNRSLKKAIRRGELEIDFDRDFESVIRACARAPRPGQDGTWITEDMISAYLELHRAGHAHSVEARLDGELVGGAYGVIVGRLFCGESMFAEVSDASKVAFVHLVRQLRAWGVLAIDCQVPTEHLERFGARAWPRHRFLELLHELRDAAPPALPWRFDADFDPLQDPSEDDDDDNW